MNEIYYNNVNPFQGVCYTPFVSYSLESDGHILAKESITLHGEIFSDCASGISGIFAKQRKMLSCFSDNYMPLTIKENSKAIFTCDHAIIESIEFEESDYAYVVPFTIDIQCYQKDFFSGHCGVYEMENSFRFDEQKDQSVEIIHTVSAKGFNNQNPAIYNATSWVYQNSGLSNLPDPMLVNLSNGNVPFLVELEEVVDRFEGSCSIIETYSFDQAHIGLGLLRYVVDINIDKKGFNTVSLKGSVELGRYSSMDLVRARYNQVDLYSIAAHIYRKSTGLNDLSAIKLKYSIKENLTTNSLEFNVDFNNDNSPIIQVKSEASIEKGESVMGAATIASITSKITSRDGLLNERMVAIENYFNTTYNPIIEFIKNMPTSFFDYDISLFRHVEDNVSVNKVDGSIDYKCIWNVANINRFLPCYVKGGDLKLESGPQLNEYNFIPVLCPSWAAFLKGYKWAYYKVVGKLNVYPGYENAALAWARNLPLAFFGSEETANSESWSEGSISFDYQRERIIK